MPQRVKKKGEQAAAADQPKMLYPIPREERCIGNKALTVDRCKELLGWQEVTESNKNDPGLPEPLFKDRNGVWIRCLNNLHNRPFYMNVCEALIQEHLTKKWRYNGESIIIGQHGSVLNGQHSLASVPLAEQDRTGNQKDHWAELWDGPIVMEKLIAFGIEESNEVIDTMDTCKPRSLADVIYRSGHFKSMKAAERRIISRMCDWAVRFLWVRTGMVDDHFASKRTHSMAMDFIQRHQRLLRCVKHIFTEDKNEGISKFLKQTGTVAGYMYLMAAGQTDGDDYDNADQPGEKYIDFDLWDQAVDFWTRFANNKDDKLREVRHGIGHLIGEDGKGNGSAAEKTAIIAKGWAAFIDHGNVTADDVTLNYHTNDEGIRKLQDWPTFGGIDRGDPAASRERRKAEEEEAAENGDDEEAPSEDNPEVLDRRKETVRQSTDAAKEKKREEQRQRLIENRRKKQRAAAGSNGDEEEDEDTVSEDPTSADEDVDAEEESNGEESEEEEAPKVEAPKGGKRKIQRKP